MAGPDFLIIGAQRAGTTWIYRNLSQHPNIWMPPIKELHYFDGPKRGRRFYLHLSRRFLHRKTKGPITRWDLRFFLGWRNDRWYASLFTDAQRKGFLAGEATPAYATQGPKMFARLKAMNPNMKFIFIMRNPLDRCWSQFKLREANEGTDVDMNAFCTSHGSIARSNYIQTIENFEKHFPPEQMKICFFEDIVRDEATFINGVYGFLGVPEIGIAQTRRSKSTTKGTTMPAEIARNLAPLLMEPTERLAARFGGHAEDWVRALRDAAAPGS